MNLDCCCCCKELDPGCCLEFISCMWLGPCRIGSWYCRSMSCAPGIPKASASRRSSKIGRGGDSRGGRGFAGVIMRYINSDWHWSRNVLSSVRCDSSSVFSTSMPSTPGTGCFSDEASFLGQQRLKARLISPGKEKIAHIAAFLESWQRDPSSPGQRPR